MSGVHVPDGGCHSNSKPSPDDVGVTTKFWTGDGTGKEKDICNLLKKVHTFLKIYFQIFNDFN